MSSPCACRTYACLAWRRDCPHRFPVGPPRATASRPLNRPPPVGSNTSSFRSRVRSALLPPRRRPGEPVPLAAARASSRAPPRGPRLRSWRRRSPLPSICAARPSQSPAGRLHPLPTQHTGSPPATAQPKPPPPPLSPPCLKPPGPLGAQSLLPATRKRPPPLHPWPPPWRTLVAAFPPRLRPPPLTFHHPAGSPASASRRAAGRRPCSLRRRQWQRRLPWSDCGVWW